MPNIKSQNSNRSKYTRRYSPRHPLAHHAVSQIDKLELRAQDIVQAMGYPLKHTIPACDRLCHVLSSEILGLCDRLCHVLSSEILGLCDRLCHVLSSEILGLNGTDVDTYFPANEFLRALLLVLDMQYEPFHDDIAQIEYDLAHYPYPLPRYSLRANVNFEFTAGANWMSRGVAASRANAYLPEDIAKMNDAERESIVQKCIDEHFKKYNGNLPYDGVIKGYQLITKQRNEIIDRVEYELPESE